MLGAVMSTGALALYANGTADGWTTKVDFYSPSIVRVTKFPADAERVHKSYSVIMTPQATDIVEETKDDGTIVYTSESMSVEVDPQGKVTFIDGRGRRLLGETDFTHAPAANEVDRGFYRVGQSWSLDPEEVIIGLGQRQCPRLNQRGETVDIWSGNTNITIPYFASEKGYGLYWDNAGESRFSDTPGGPTTFTSEVAPGVDYYFLYKDGTQDGVIASIRDLTGDATMFPLWTMGHWQCRERYKSSDELTAVLDRYRALRIPLDGIVQDWQYWGCDSNWNAMKFMNPHYINKMGDKKWMRYLPNDEDPSARYPEPRIKSPEEMVQYVHDHDAHLMISIWASFGPWTEQYRKLDKMGALLPFETWPLNRGVKPYDAFNPQARDLYWKYLTNLYDMGFDAWWTDSTEPDHWEKPGDRDYMTHDGSWRSVKNAFPLVTNRGIYEHQRAMKGNNKRSVQMTRCGAMGEQHYGTFSWSGDVVSEWEVMKNQIPSGLNFVICGIPFWNTDIGGFFGWNYRNDNQNPALQEIQVRWMQWGCFMPLMRNHASSPVINELYEWGKEGEWPYEAQKKFIELRYRLLPYIYSAAGATVTDQANSLMRPLMMDFAKDSTAIRLDDQYMFGREILVKPVTDPLYTYRDDKGNGFKIFPEVERAAAPVDVYLPDGTEWWDFWDNSLQKGGQWVKRLAPIDIMPVYVRAGSIIPFGPNVQYAAEKPWDSLEVRVYPGANGTFVLYEDAGDGYEYEQGEYTQIPFAWDDATRTLTIGARQGEYPGMLSERTFRVMAVDAGSPSGHIEPASGLTEVRYDGSPLTLKL